MGDGIIDLPRIRALIDAAGYDGPIEVEVINPALATVPGEALLADIAVAVRRARLRRTRRVDGWAGHGHRRSRSSALPRPSCVIAASWLAPGPPGDRSRAAASATAAAATASARLLDRRHCSIATRFRTVDGPGYVASVETGTINRGIYEIAVPRDWNRRLIYNFGGGCTDGWYRQGPGTAGVLDAFMLSRGYAVASSSLNVFGNNCQEVTAAETMMMVKEHFIETHGPVAHTQGFGCSGGSYQQHQIADNYPGLLDGILPGCSFPEVTQATVSFITDAWLLDDYFQQAVGYTDEQKRAVTGFANYATAPNVAFGARRIDPRVFCGVVPVGQRYDPVHNPGGVRCDLYDHAINIWGRDPATGFARRPLDNVGIQYGLRALNAGAITSAQFLDLNEHVGGFDADANIVPARTVADPEAARRAYRTGRVTNGGLGLASIPIVDYRAYNDDAPNGDIHVRYHSFSMRERLREANGHARNQVMLVEDQRYGLYSTESPLLQRAILALDRWITTGHRPADLEEGCMTRDEHPTFIAEPQRRDRSTRCERLYPRPRSRARWRAPASPPTSSSAA